MDGSMVRPPLVIRDRSGDVNVFRTALDLLGWAEAIDVEAGEYEAWDSTGRILRLVVDIEDQIDIEPTGNFDLSRLEQILLSFLAAVRAHQGKDASGVASRHFSDLLEELID